MDCDAFRNSEIDMLYGELDPSTVAAMDAHAAGCAECAARMAKWRSTKSAFPSLVVPIPVGLEAKILAAAEAAMPKKQAPPAAGGAKIFQFLARPQFAIAASLVLVAGAAVIFGGMNVMSSKKAETASMPASAPMASAATGKLEERSADPSPPPPSVVADTTPMASAASDSPLQLAKADFDRGKLKDACPKFDSLAANDPEAELFADKCVQRSKGCMAAAPKFDATAQKNAGTETGSRAALEAARCYRAMNDARAQGRYAALQDDQYVGNEAQQESNAPAQVAARKALAAPPAATAGAPAKPAARPTKAAKPPAAATDGLQ